MRYFLQVSYKGTNYAGFQIQKNSVTIQAKLEEALQTFYRHTFSLTGSSRTDAGVHARQNFFHADTFLEIEDAHLYNINSILPTDIVLEKVYKVADAAHSRFNATSREYTYYIYSAKNAFITDTAWFYPYPLNMEALQAAAEVIKGQIDFSNYAKRNVQVTTHNCTIEYSAWSLETDCLMYTVRANRFLRGMVRALVATMLKVGRGKLSIAQLEETFTNSDSSNVDFSAPAHGLFLVRVEYPSNILSV